MQAQARLSSACEAFADQLASSSSREPRKKMFFLAPKAELVRQARHTHNVMLKNGV